MTEQRRTKADSAPRDSEQDCRQDLSSARHIVHDITTKEATTHRDSSAVDTSSAEATVSSVVDTSSAVAMASSAVDTSSAADTVSSRRAMDSRRVDSILRHSVVDIVSSVADTSSAVDMVSSVVDTSSAAVTSRVVAVDMASSVEDTVSTLLAMIPMQSIA